MYIIKDPDVVVRAPYQPPEGTTILPSPALSEDSLAPLNITMETGSGSSDKYDLCLLEMNENSKIIGVKLSVNRPGLGSSGSSTGKIKSLVCGETKSSELSDAVLMGNDEFTSLIQQKLIADNDPETTHRYENVYLTLNGADNGVLIMGDSGKPVEPAKLSSTPWDVIFSGGVEISGSPSSSANTQRALSFVNVRPKIEHATLIFSDDFPEYADHARQAIHLKDTPRSSISFTRPVSKLAKHRAEDWQVFVEAERAEFIHIYLGGNAHSWFAENVRMSTGNIPVHIYQGPEVLAYDIPPTNLANPEVLLSYSRRAGAYLGSVAEIGGVCQKFDNASSYDWTNPLIQSRRLQYPADVKVIDTTDPEAYLASCTTAAPWYSHWQTWVTACGMTAGGVFAYIVSSSFIRKILGRLRKPENRYAPVIDFSDRNEELNVGGGEVGSNM